VQQVAIAALLWPTKLSVFEVPENGHSRQRRVRSDLMRDPGVHGRQNQRPVASRFERVEGRAGRVGFFAASRWPDARLTSRQRLVDGNGSSEPASYQRKVLLFDAMSREGLTQSLPGGPIARGEQNP
jgi:hypothetical protein